MFIIISCNSENSDNFENQVVEIKINIFGNGSVEYDKSLLYNIGDYITLIANPEVGNYFSYWGGEKYSNVKTITFNLPSSYVEIDANFNTISPEIVVFDQTKTDKDNLFIIENGSNYIPDCDELTLSNNNFSKFVSDFISAIECFFEKTYLSRAPPVS